MLLYSVLYGFWIMNAVAFNGDALITLATQFLLLAERQRATVPLMMGHGLMAFSLLTAGSFAASRRHCDQAIALHNPAEHRSLAMLFGQDPGVAHLCSRSLALWFLGYPDASLADTNQFLKEAHELGQAGTLLHALNQASVTHYLYGAYARAEALAKELFTLTDEKDVSLFWKATETVFRGVLFALTGKASDAVRAITSGMTSLRSTGAALYEPWHLSHLAMAYAELGQPDDARRCIDDAITKVERSKEKWCETEVHRIAGEIALQVGRAGCGESRKAFRARPTRRPSAASRSPAELRAAMSLARLWRDQGKAQQARELLAPVYGWFTEGFDTRDLKEAKSLLDALA